MCFECNLDRKQPLESWSVVVQSALSRIFRQNLISSHPDVFSKNKNYTNLITITILQKNPRKRRRWWLNTTLALVLWASRTQDGAEVQTLSREDSPRGERKRSYHPDQDRMLVNGVRNRSHCKYVTRNSSWRCIFGSAFIKKQNK
jgi:hypothetical protein